jgi:archaellum biogenesis protein FlaJ (TadC family)
MIKKTKFCYFLFDSEKDQVTTRELKGRMDWYSLVLGSSVLVTMNLSLYTVCPLFIFLTLIINMKHVKVFDYLSYSIIFFFFFLNVFCIFNHEKHPNLWYLLIQIS